jgi:hypothetical protein
MNARHIIAFLLTLAIFLTAAVHPSSAKMTLRAAEEEEPQLTPEEEREARDIALQFSERLKTKSDIGPVIDELFVSDFSERLRHSPSDSMPMAFLVKSLALTASRDELRRYYVAYMNFHLLVYRQIEVTMYLREQAGEDNTEWGPEDALTPEMINVLLSDPTIAEIAKELKEDEKDERGKEDDGNQPAQGGDSSQAAGATTQAEADDGEAPEDSEMHIIKNYRQLESVSLALEKTSELMRQRLAGLPSIPPKLLTGDEAQSQQDSSKPNLTSLPGEFYGYPKDTPVIHLDIMPFCFSLIKINGHLKILSATIHID